MKKKLVALSTIGIASMLLLGRAHGGNRWVGTEVSIYNNVAADGALGDVRGS